LYLPTVGGPQFLCGSAPLREKKRKKNKSRKVGKAQRQSAAAESHTEWTTISLRLPTAGRALRLCERKEKKIQETRSKSLLTVRFLCAFASLRAKIKMLENEPSLFAL
jgi:hypothetical protein